MRFQIRDAFFEMHQTINVKGLSNIVMEDGDRGWEYFHETDPWDWYSHVDLYETDEFLIFSSRKVAVS